MKPWGKYKRMPTPGPWAPGSVSMDRRSGRYIRPVSGGLSICQVTVSRPNWRENARMIAVAPLSFNLIMAAPEISTDEFARQARYIYDLAAGVVPFPAPQQWLCDSCRRGYEATGKTAPVGLHCPHKEVPDEEG